MPSRAVPRDPVSGRVTENSFESSLHLAGNPLRRSMAILNFRIRYLPARCKTQGRADSFGDGNSQVQGRVTIDQLSE